MGSSTCSWHIQCRGNSIGSQHKASGRARLPATHRVLAASKRCSACRCLHASGGSREGGIHPAPRVRMAGGIQARTQHSQHKTMGMCLVSGNVQSMNHGRTDPRSAAWHVSEACVSTRVMDLSYAGRWASACVCGVNKWSGYNQPHILHRAGRRVPRAWHGMAQGMAPPRMRLCDWPHAYERSPAPCGTASCLFVAGQAQGVEPMGSTMPPPGPAANGEAGAASVPLRPCM